MVRLLMLAAALTFGATLHRVAVADEPKGGKAAPADPTAQLLAKLKQPLALTAADELLLPEFAAQVEKAMDVPVSINTDAFRNDASSRPEEATVRVAGSKKLAGSVVLRNALGGQGLTYLVRRDHVEIVPIAFALKESRQPAKTDANGNELAPYPLVSAVFRDKPLNEALEQVAADHDLTIVLSPQAADQKAAFVTARLLNVPADRAVELLALQADLRVVRRGSAFLVTSKDHEGQLFNERNDRQRQKIETENMRNQLGGAGVLGICGNVGAPGVGVAGNGGSIGCFLGVGGNGAAGLAGNGRGFGGVGAFGSGPVPGGIGGKMGFGSDYGI